MSIPRERPRLNLDPWYFISIVIVRLVKAYLIRIMAVFSYKLFRTLFPFECIRNQRSSSDKAYIFPS